MILVVSELQVEREFKGHNQGQLLIGCSELELQLMQQGD